MILIIFVEYLKINHCISNESIHRCARKPSLILARRQNDDHLADETVVDEVPAVAEADQAADLVAVDHLTVKTVDRVGLVQNLQDRLAGVMALQEAVAVNHQIAVKGGVLLEDPALQVLETRIDHEEIKERNYG